MNELFEKIRSGTETDKKDNVLLPEELEEMSPKNATDADHRGKKWEEIQYF